MLIQRVDCEVTEFCHAAEAHLSRASRLHAKEHSLEGLYREIAVPAINLLLLSLYAACESNEDTVTPECVLSPEITFKAIGTLDKSTATRTLSEQTHATVARLGAVVRFVVVSKARLDERQTAGDQPSYDLGELVTAAIEHVAATTKHARRKPSAKLSPLSPVAFDRRGSDGADRHMHLHTADAVIPEPWTRKSA